jgi:Putative Ig domain/Divergent InlB B-repeat domain
MPSLLRLSLLFSLAFGLIAAARAAITLGPDTLPATSVSGDVWSVQLTATGATDPSIWTAPSLPPGLSINAATGLVSGTLGPAGNYVLLVKVTDSLGAIAQKPWNVKITAAPSSGGGNTGGGGAPPSSSLFTITVVNGTLAGGATTGQFNQGDLVTVTANPPPPGQWLKTWAGTASFSNNLATTTTFTVPYGGATITALFATPPALVQPVSGHPRMWVNQSDIPRLRAWAANPANQVYHQGLRLTLATALQAYGRCFPGGVPALPYPDDGDNFGYAGARVSPTLVYEHHAMILAFFGLIDPDPVARLNYAQKARDLLMYQMNESAKGHAAGLPFRDPLFILFNRPHTVGESWPLIVDWLQGVTDASGQPVAVLTAQDKLTIRDVFLQWCDDCLHAYICGGDHPSPIGTTNSSALLSGFRANRVAGNNYFACHARLVTMMPLALDAADDPPLIPAAPEGVLGNTLRSYLPNATGAWLYQQYALFGDAAAVRADLGLPATADVGLSSGGIPVEGTLYGHSYGYVLGQLLALQTTGYNDPALSGPQAALLNAPVWERFAEGFISQMVNTTTAHSYLGPVRQMAAFGDMQRLYITEDFMQPYALLALMREKQGDSSLLPIARWFSTHAVAGGQANLLKRVATPWNTAESILYFLLFDPAAAPAPDPRPGYAHDFLDVPQARMLVRTGWSANDTFFTYRAAPLTINHVNCDAGQFELWRKGEWLTKELSNYDDFGVGQSSLWHNTLCLQNWCSAATPTLGFPEPVFFAAGSMWNNGASAGDPTSLVSLQPAHAHVQSDLTKLYNRPSAFNPGNALIDITQASRSVLYLRNDYIVIYDRAASNHAGFKRFNLNLTVPPTIATAADGCRVAVATTPGGQKLFVSTVLPLAPSMQWIFDNGTVTHPAELEPSLGRLQVESSTPPLVERFLHVLQAGDALTPRAACTRLQAVSGDVFQGVAFADRIALFAYDPRTAFTGTSYDAPAAAVYHHISGLPSLRSFRADLQWRPDGSAHVTLALGGPLVSDSGGTVAFVATPTGALDLNETTLAEFLTAHFGAGANQPGGGLPTDDPDGDGQTNAEEYLTGTSPTDPASAFRAPLSAAPDGQLHLTFQAMPGKSYTIQRKTDLADSVWQRQTDVPATFAGQPIDFAFAAPTSGAIFYRVVTPQVP